MHVGHIEGAEPITLGAPDNWDQAKIVVSPLPYRFEDVGGYRFRISAWKPTPGELAALYAGAAIHLGVCSPVHPVVSMEVGPIPCDAPGVRPGFLISEDIDDAGQHWCRIEMVIGPNNFTGAIAIHGTEELPQATCGLVRAMLEHATKEQWL